MFNPTDPRHIKLATTTRAAHGYISDREREALDCIYGDPERIAQRIKPFSAKENPAKLAWRRDVSMDHFDNFVVECGSTYPEQIRKAGEIQRTCDVDDALRDWLKGQYDGFLQHDASLLMLALPETYFYLDWPPGARPLSMADQQQQRMWPRPSIQLPSAVTRVVEDPDGEIDWIVRRMVSDIGERRVTWYEVRDEENIYALAEDGTFVSYLTNAYGEPSHVVAHGIPGGSVVRCQFQRNAARSAGCHDTCGHAFLHAVTRKTLACLQIISMLAEAGYFGLTYEFYASAQTLAAIKEKGGRGNTEVIPIENEDSRPVILPGYVQKDMAIMETLAKWAFEWLPASIYRAARLRDRSTDQTANTSGVAKMMDAVPEIAALAVVANRFQAVDEAITRRVCRAYHTHLKDEDISVRYPTRFVVKGEREQLDDLNTLLDAMAKDGAPTSTTLARELIRQYVATVLPDLAEETRKTIEDELAAVLVADDASDDALNDAPSFYDTDTGLPLTRPRTLPRYGKDATAPPSST